MFIELCKMIIMMGAITTLVFIAWIDYKTMEIPDWCHLILFGLGGLQIVFGDSISLESRMLGVIAMSLPMFIANLIRQDSFGGGDIKMCGSTGFLLGMPQVMIGSMMALLLAGMYGSITLLLRTKKPTDAFPLGPFLSLGFVAVMLGELLGYGL